MKKIVQARLGLQSNAFALPCSIWVSPPLKPGLAWPSSPAVLVVMGALFSV